MMLDPSRPTLLRLRARRYDAAGDEDAHIDVRIEDDRVITTGRAEDCLFRIDRRGPERAIVFDQLDGVRRLHPWAVQEGFVAYGFFTRKLDVRRCPPPILLDKVQTIGDVTVGPWRIQFVVANPPLICEACNRVAGARARIRGYCMDCGGDLGEPRPSGP